MRSTRTFLITMLCVALSSAASLAQSSGHRVLWVAPGLELTHASGDWHDVDAFAHRGDPAWSRFVDVLGRGWRVTFDAAFGSPQWIVGSYGGDRAPLTEAAAIESSERLMRDLASPLRVDDPRGLHRWFAETTTNAHGHRIFGVDYVQRHAGYAVRTIDRPLRVRARWNLTLGKLVALGSDAVPGLNVDVANPIDRRTAVALARGYVPRYAPGTGRVRSVDTFILVGMDAAHRAAARLVHAVEIEVRGSEPHSWVVVLDAKRGERLYVADHLCHADIVGSVMIGMQPQRGGRPPAAPFAVTPAPDLLVRAGLGSAYTDAAGAFRISTGGTAPQNVTGQLSGRWANVINFAGARLTFSTLATPGVPAHVVLNPVYTDEFATAETTAYFWTTFTRNMIAAEWVGWQGLAGLLVNVNLNQACNAFYSGGTINFFRSSSACSNTAISDVIAHEYGHAFHEHFFGSIANGQFSEGIGDHFGLYARTSAEGRVVRHLGEGFYTHGGGIRDYRASGAANNTQWPAQGKTAHKGGEIWAGAMIDLADALVSKHGFNGGFRVAKNITLAMFSRRPSDMPGGIIETMIQDDNDADLSNGSPNFFEIAGAADRHGIPRPPNPTIVQFAHRAIATTADVVNGYPVVAVIKSSAAAIGSANLHYRINGGSVVAVPLARIGDTFFAAIPAQRAVTGIQYWLTATDARQNVGRFPPTGSLSFSVAREIVVMQDDFEVPSGWGPDPADNAATGRFERADPIAASSGTLVTQPENDTSASGVYCWVTQNGTRGQTASAHDVDGGPTSVVSPTFDLSGLAPGSVTLSFNYWLTMYTQVNDVLRVDRSFNGGTSWSTLWSASSSSASWRSATVGLPGPYTARMRLRFQVADNPNDSLTDCLIDDVVVRLLDDNVVALRADSRTPAIGGTLGYTLRAAREPGRAFVYVVSFNPGAPLVPGVGRLAVGIPFYALWFGVTDATGFARFRLPIPNQPILRGLEVYTQAMVGGATPVLSNPWQVTLR